MVESNHHDYADIPPRVQPFPSHPSKNTGSSPFTLQLQVRDEPTFGPAGPCSPAAPGCPCCMITVKWVGKAGCKNTQCPRGELYPKGHGRARELAHLGSSHQPERKLSCWFQCRFLSLPETSPTPALRSSSSEFQIFRILYLLPFYP